jgi:hypothetical protein
MLTKYVTHISVLFLRERLGESRPSVKQESPLALSAGVAPRRRCLSSKEFQRKARLRRTIMAHWEVLLHPQRA